MDEFDMTSVARELGIGVATLYGYVEGRDHLATLVSRRLAKRNGIEDRGQKWQDALREHADRTFAVYRETPRLIPQLMDGMLGGLADSDHSNSLLRILINRGLSPSTALSLFLEANQLVIGAAVAAAYLETLRTNAGGAKKLRETTRKKCDEAGYSALRSSLEQADITSIAADYRPGLERLIAESSGEEPR
ncbi:TetR/AcrR family transcriptional regulator C-terminal domain-containing protein [Erythrobacter litoralis]|uniref:TetR/AcrR family transcriptional regulator C-terminal domain-containing protein n=1 Tax=Erythrobacter litoralis TaxID=39960 RepID=UPI002435483D|nr:TetR/AcrR family transcriptional regulator C-terminal domain-containing protein [Erythrobacter litoralis]